MSNFHHFEDEDFMAWRRPRLQRIKETGKFSDLILETTDGCKFKVHKNILAVTSEYFWELLDSSADIENIQIDIMKEQFVYIVDYIYTGAVDFPASLSKDLFIKSQQFQLKNLQKFCSEILENEANHDNFLELYKFSVQYLAHNLREKCTRIATENAELLENFINSLTVEEMKVFLLQENHIDAIANQEHLMKTLINWIKHDFGIRSEFLLKVMKLIKFNSISHDYIRNNLLKDRILTSHIEFLPEIMKIMFSRIDKSQENPKDNKSVIQKTKKDPRPSELQKNELGKDSSSLTHPVTVAASHFEQKKIFMLHQSETEFSMKMEKFDLSETKWTNYFEFLKKVFQGFSACEHKNQIFISGGYIAPETLKDFECYDLFLGRSSECPKMLEGRMLHETLSMNGKIYACGGRTYEGEALTSTEYFDFGKNKWIRSASLNESKFCFGLTSSEYCLYAIGGHYSDSLEILDVRTDSWYILDTYKNLNENRAITINESIFCVDSEGKGGIFDTRNLKWIKDIPKAPLDSYKKRDFDIVELNEEMFGIFYDSSRSSYGTFKYSQKDNKWVNLNAKGLKCGELDSPIHLLALSKVNSSKKW